MVETLEDGAMDDQNVAVDFLQRINKDVDRMSGIVSDLLELSHLESGFVPLNLAPVDIRPLVEEVVDLLRCRPHHGGPVVVVAGGYPTLRRGLKDRLPKLEEARFRFDLD